MSLNSKIRKDQLANLSSWWKSVLTGKSSFVLVTGESGEGKQSLVNAFREEIENLRAVNSFHWAQADCRSSELIRTCAALCDDLIQSSDSEFIEDFAANISKYGTSLIGANSIFDPKVLAASQYVSFQNLVSSSTLAFTPMESKISLYEALIELRLDDIDHICLYLEVDSESFPRKTKRELARALVEDCKRRGKLNNLSLQIQKIRPSHVRDNSIKRTLSDIGKVFTQVSKKHALVMVISCIEKLDDVGLDQLIQITEALNEYDGKTMILGVGTKLEQGMSDKINELLDPRHVSAVIDLTQQRLNASDVEKRELFEDIVEGQAHFLPVDAKNALFEGTTAHPGMTKLILRNLGLVGNQIPESLQQAITESQIRKQIENYFARRTPNLRLSEEESRVLNVVALCNDLLLFKVAAQASVALRFSTSIESASNCLSRLEIRHSIIEKIPIQGESIRVETRYRFVNSYYAKFIAERLTAQDQKSIHLKIASTLEEVFKWRIYQVEESIMFHYESADDPHAAKYMKELGFRCLQFGYATKAARLFKSANSFIERPDAKGIENYEQLSVDIERLLSVALSRNPTTLEEGIKLSRKAIERAESLHLVKEKAEAQLEFFASVFDAVDTYQFSDFDKQYAFKALNEARNIYASLDMELEQAECDANIGNWLGRIEGDSARSRYALYRALDVFNKREDFRQQGITQYNLGLCESNLNPVNFDEAIRLFRAAAVAAEKANDKECIADTSFGLGDVYKNQSFSGYSLSESYQHYVDSLKITIELNNFSLLGQLILEMVDILSQCNKPIEAHRYVAFLSVIFENEKDSSLILERIQETFRRLKPISPEQLLSIYDFASKKAGAVRPLKENIAWLTRSLYDIEP